MRTFTMSNGAEVVLRNIAAVQPIENTSRTFGITMLGGANMYPQHIYDTPEEAEAEREKLIAALRKL